MSNKINPGLSFHAFANFMIRRPLLTDVIASLAGRGGK